MKTLRRLTLWAALVCSPAAAADINDYQGLTVDTRACGADQAETRDLVYRLYPRTPAERQALFRFADHAYGIKRPYSQSLRPRVQALLTMPKERIEHAYWEMFKKYSGGTVPVPVSWGNSGSRAMFYTRQSASLIEFDPAQAGTVGFIPSMVMRHEVDHVRQGGYVTPGFAAPLPENPENQIRESLAALYDVASLVRADRKCREDAGLDPDYADDGVALYDLEVNFPGQTVPLTDLVAMGETPRPAMKVWHRHADAVERMIYGGNRKVGAKVPAGFDWSSLR